MNKVRIITVGKIKNPALQKLEQDFLKQNKKYAEIEVISIKGENVPDERSNHAKEEEGKKILKLIADKPNDLTVALDEHGEHMTSSEFSHLLQTNEDQGTTITFITGGPFGLSKEVLKQANKLLALSKMTLLHEIAYTLLLEQLFRGFSIAKGSPYHK